jgi:hypothetical protein
MEQLRATSLNTSWTLLVLIEQFRMLAPPKDPPWIFQNRECASTQDARTMSQDESSAGGQIHLSSNHLVQSILCTLLSEQKGCSIHLIWNSGRVRQQVWCKAIAQARKTTYSSRSRLRFYSSVHLNTGKRVGFTMEMRQPCLLCFLLVVENLQDEETSRALDDQSIEPFIITLYRPWMKYIQHRILHRRSWESLTIAQPVLRT